jgi:hypothetical protein
MQQQQQDQFEGADGFKRLLEGWVNFMIESVAFSVEVPLRRNTGQLFVSWKHMLGVWLAVMLMIAAFANHTLQYERPDLYGGEAEQFMEERPNPYDPTPLWVFAQLFTVGCVLHKAAAQWRFWRRREEGFFYNGDPILGKLFGRWFNDITIKRFIEPLCIFLAAPLMGGFFSSVPLMAYLMLAALCTGYVANQQWWQL